MIIQVSLLFVRWSFFSYTVGRVLQCPFICCESSATNRVSWGQTILICHLVICLWQKLYQPHPWEGYAAPWPPQARNLNIHLKTKEAVSLTPLSHFHPGPQSTDTSVLFKDMSHHGSGNLEAGFICVNNLLRSALRRRHTTEAGEKAKQGGLGLVPRECWSMNCTTELAICLRQGDLPHSLCVSQSLASGCLGGHGSDIISQASGFCWLEGNSMEKAVTSNQSSWTVDVPASWRRSGHKTNNIYHSNTMYCSVPWWRTCPLGSFSGHKGKCASSTCWSCSNIPS